MNTALKTVLALGLGFAIAGAVVAAEDKTPKPIQVQDKVTVKATVEAIDQANRTITIKGKKGNMITMPVDEAVERFDAIKVGDTIEATYYESVVVEVLAPGTAPAGMTVATMGGTSAGTKPGGMVAGQATMTVTIMAIDATIPAVTVKTEDGSTVSFRVQKPKYLKEVKVGDQVMITKTEALAVAVKESK